MSDSLVLNALLTLPPGKSITYFVGFLDRALDRGGSGDGLKAAMMAAALYRQGKVHLTQRRLGLPVKDGMVDWRTGIGPGFEYIATGAGRRERNDTGRTLTVGDKVN